MKTRHAMAALLLLGVQALGLERPPPALPPAVSQVPFVATESRSDQPRAHITDNLTLSISGGFGFPEMDGLNDYVGWINRNFAGDIDEFDVVTQVYAGVGYDLRGGLALGLGIAYMDADTDGTTYFMSQPHHLEITLNTIGIEASLTKSWGLGALPLSLRATLAGGHYWSSYRETENGYRASGDDHAWGARAMVGLGWNITERVSLDLEVGYRWLEFDDYGVDLVSPGAPAAEADLSGPMVQAGCTWRF